MLRIGRHSVTSRATFRPHPKEAMCLVLTERALDRFGTPGNSLFVENDPSDRIEDARVRLSG